MGNKKCTSRAVQFKRALAYFSNGNTTFLVPEPMVDQFTDRGLATLGVFRWRLPTSQQIVLDSEPLVERGLAFGVVGDLAEVVKSPPDFLAPLTRATMLSVGKIGVGPAVARAARSAYLTHAAPLL